MSKLSSNAERRGENPVEDKHRSGPEIDLGRRRFAWLTLGTASTATLMSRSALGKTMECGGSWNHSAMHSMMTGKNWTCKGLSHTYWRKGSNRDNWPQPYKFGSLFNNVCWDAPAFEDKLIRVLRKKATPIPPPVWEAYMGQIDGATLDNYFKALKNCGRAVVAEMLNAMKFHPNYELPPGAAQDYFKDAWLPPIAPGTLEECSTQVEQCTNWLNTLKSQLEQNYS